MTRIAAALLAAALPLAACFEEQTALQHRFSDQDLNESESEAADRAIEVLLGRDNVQMVFCLRGGIYEVHGKVGKLFFRRLHTREGYFYEVVRREGQDPLANQDPRALADLDSELAAGSNPKGTDYRQQDSGYSGPDDRRISFLHPDRVSYPLAYQRIAALFDGKDAGDLVVEFTPWGWYPMGNHNGLDNVGAHGQLSIVSSRAPLIFAGKGARRGTLIDGWASSVDIAPTAARALGIKNTWGVDHTGHFSHDVFLKWQDGQVLEQVLDGQTPEVLLILLNDALTNSELQHRLAGGDALPTYRWMVQNGTMFRYGQVVNFPSNTFASHNTIGTGAWSGHHGLIDNWFYDRKTGKRHDPLTQVMDTGKFLVDEVETLHEAVHRSFPNWHPVNYPLGNFTLSINDPLTRGADLALLEGVQPIDWDRCPEPTGLALPPLDSTISQRAQAVDNLAVTTFVKAFLGTRTEEGRTVRCSHPPRFVIINLGLTDDVAHETGPHSDGMRRALIQTDQRQQILFDTLKKAGVFDRTLIIFTSDHGQMLQDNQRNADFQAALRQAGLGFVATNAFVYLRTFDVTVSQTSFRRGIPTRLEVMVRDDDTGEPVEAAEVSVTSGGVEARSITDAGGHATIEITPGADEVSLTVADGPSVAEAERRTKFTRTYR